MTCSKIAIETLTGQEAENVLRTFIATAVEVWDRLGKKPVMHPAIGTVDALKLVGNGLVLADDPEAGKHVMPYVDGRLTNKNGYGDCQAIAVAEW